MKYGDVYFHKGGVNLTVMLIHPIEGTLLTSAMNVWKLVVLNETIPRGFQRMDRLSMNDKDWKFVEAPQ